MPGLTRSEEPYSNRTENNGESTVVPVITEEEAQEPDSPRFVVEAESSAESSRKPEDNHAIILQGSPERNASVLGARKYEDSSLLIGQDAQNTILEIPKIEEYDQDRDENNNEEDDVVPEMLIVSEIENKDRDSVM